MYEPTQHAILTNVGTINKQKQYFRNGSKIKRNSQCWDF